MSTNDKKEPTVAKNDTPERPSWDLGVPMLPGDGSEPAGPEDALGVGPKRGDYSGRVGPSTYRPHAGTEPQKPRVEDIGDEPGKKGGVDTDA